MSRYEEVEDWWGPGCQALLCQVLPLLPRKYEKPDTQAKPITIHLRAAQEKQNGFPFQIKLLFGPLDIQLVWYILKQLIISVSVKRVDIDRAASPGLGTYPPLTSTPVNNLTPYIDQSSD